ncbi:MAG: ABC transporter ATP-binding protein [Salibacteraceae bacterium]
MSTYAVEVNGLSKVYGGEHKAVNNISFKIEKGSIYGLLGPNGAGKTTLVSMLSGIIKKTSGSYFLLGTETNQANFKQHQSILGIAPQEIALYELLTPIENLNYFGTLQGLTTTAIKTKSEELLTQFGLWDVRNKQAGQFSGGMKRRLNLVVALLHDPEILFLDEPTEGIDIQSRTAILKFIKDLNSTKGTTIIYTSHILSEAEEICSDVLIIDNGQKQIEGKMIDLLKKDGQNLQEVFLEITGNQYRDLG